MKNRLTVRQFKHLVKTGDLPRSVRAKAAPSLCLVKQYPAEIKALSPDVANRTLLFTISTGAIDREGDTISPAGWDLSQYLVNPVVLWCHEYRMFPIAACPAIAVEGAALKAQAEFPPAGRFQMSDDVYDATAGIPRANGDGLYRMLFATSVGFMPTRWEYVDEGDRWGVDFLEQILLEFSIVTVPANHECVNEPMDDPQEDGARLLSSTMTIEAPALPKIYPNRERIRIALAVADSLAEASTTERSTCS